MTINWNRDEHFLQFVKVHLLARLLSSSSSHPDLKKKTKISLRVLMVQKRQFPFLFYYLAHRLSSSYLCVWASKLGLKWCSWPYFSKLVPLLPLDHPHCALPFWCILYLPFNHFLRFRIINLATNQQ